MLKIPPGVDFTMCNNTVGAKFAAREMVSVGAQFFFVLLAHF
jgi:hypothetical protein